MALVGWSLWRGWEHVGTLMSQQLLLQKSGHLKGRPGDAALPPECLPSPSPVPSEGSALLNPPRARLLSTSSLGLWPPLGCETPPKLPELRPTRRKDMCLRA